MQTETNNLSICLNIDDSTIYKFNEAINEQSIVKNANNIKKVLDENNAKPEKIQNIFELLIEVMQNMMNYSYDSRQLENNKREAQGALALSYNSNKDIYTLQSCNLIKEEQENTIQEKINTINHLDNKELRQLSRTKMRTKEDLHEKGAGLGLITIARRCIKPIEIKFYPYKNKILQFKLILTI